MTKMERCIVGLLAESCARAMDIALVCRGP